MAKRCVSTPFGDVVIEADHEAILSLRFANSSDRDASPLLDAAEAWMKGYATGQLLPLPQIAPEGTAFQRAVWQALQAIPWGETRTYAQIATAIGRPKAVRAVGQACGANPILLMIPCHRVVAAQGLGGFAAGLPLKEHLLAHEKERSC